MSNFNVVEKFVSINGEGTKAGQLAVFIRFKGCNLQCSYCDTKWANEQDVSYEVMSDSQIIDYILYTKIKNVTLTGGEPLLQKDIYGLLEKLSKIDIYTEIETNGSILLKKFKAIGNSISFTMDYKLPFSNMNTFMNTDNFFLLDKEDTVKFVCATQNDLNKSLEIIKKYDLINRCNVYFSPVFNEIEPKQIVQFMIDNNLNGTNLQLQMHKFIWEPNQKGV